jgi:hypothetical protein
LLILLDFEESVVPKVYYNVFMLTVQSAKNGR